MRWLLYIYICISLCSCHDRDSYSEYIPKDSLSTYSTLKENISEELLNNYDISDCGELCARQHHRRRSPPRCRTHRPVRPPASPRRAPGLRIRRQA